VTQKTLSQTENTRNERREVGLSHAGWDHQSHKGKGGKSHRAVPHKRGIKTIENKKKLSWSREISVASACSDDTAVLE